MKKYLLLIAFVLIAIAMVMFFYPKKVGGNLCGPVCPVEGLHYYEQDCLGIKVRTTIIDAYWDTCYGLPFGDKVCYGIPYGETENFEDRVLDCDYTI